MFPLEKLETRAVLTAVSWDGGGGDFNWNNAANWSNDALPGASDDVTIDISNTDASIFGAAGSINSLTSYENIVLNDTLNIAASSSIASLNQFGGVLTGTGDIDIVGDYIWQTGTLSGPANLTVHGRLELQEAGAFNNHWRLDERHLISLGDAHATGAFGPEFTTARMLMYAGAEFHNVGNFNIETAVGMRFIPMDATPTKVVNSGNFTNSTTDVSGFEGVPFENSGNLIVSAGQLQLGGGLSNTGNFHAAAGTTLLVSQQLNSTGTSSGDGHLHLQYATQHGSLNFPGDVTLEGSTIEGDLNLPGDVIIPAFSAASFNGTPATIGGSLSIVGGVNGSGSVTVNGLITWNTGEGIFGGGTIVANGGLHITGNRLSRLSGTTIVNAGSAVFDGGTLELERGAAIHNLASGTFEVRNDAALFNNFNAPMPHFDNDGVFQKLSGADETSLSVAFNNNGLVQVETGRLVLMDGTPSLSTGDFTVSSGATLVVSGQFTPASDITGGGNLVLQNVLHQGTVNVGGDATVTGGTFEGSFTVGGDLLVPLNYGVTFNGPTATIAGDANVNRMYGTSDVVIGGLFTWNLNGGAQLFGTGRTIANGGMILDGNGDARLQQRTLINAGTGIFQSGTVRMGDGSVIQNLAGATLEIRNDADFTNLFQGVDPQIINQGSFSKFSGNDESLVYILMNNNGNISVQSGQLTLVGGGSSTGDYSVGSGATLVVSGTLSSTSDITGSGNVTFANCFDQGTVNIGGDVTVAGGTFEGPFTVGGDLLVPLNYGVTFNGPTATIAGDANVNRMYGTSDVVIGGLFTWNLNGGAQLFGTGRTMANGGMILDGSGDARLQQRTLINAGLGVWNGTSIFIADNAQIINTGVFDIRSDGVFNRSGECTTFTNAGQLIKTANGGVTQLVMALSNSGSVDIRTGSLSLSCGYIPDGGQVVGSVDAPTITNPGSLVLVPSPPLTVIDYSQTSTGQLRERINGPTPGLEYGQLVVTGSVALAGTFSVEVTTPYSPALGQQFRVIDNRGGSQINGTFDGLPEGTLLWSGNFGFLVSYAGGDGNDFVLTLDQLANTAPTASAGGPYTVVAGSSVTLDASGSSDAEQSATSLLYTWDLDGDGIFGEAGVAAGRGDELTVQPVFSSVGLNGPATYTVQLRVQDQGGLVGTSSAIINILAVNNRPTLALTTPVDGDFKTSLNFSVAATDIDAVDAGTFVFSVNWGDGTTTTTSAGSQLRNLSHIYNSVSPSGTFTITASVQSGLGARQLVSDSVSKELVVLGWSIVADPLTASLPLNQQRALMVVVGSQGPDDIKLKTHDDDYYKITIRERQENVRHRGTLFGDVDRILVFGMNGSDTITLDDDIEVSAEVWGGQGDDQIKGGSGHDAIFGEQGNDSLYGGDGRDLIVGGTGADRIHGDDSDDILIAGFTAFDNEYRLLPGASVLSFQNQRRAVESILAEWSSSRSLANRISNLHGGTSSTRANGAVYLLENQTVFDDNVKDTIWGDGGTDWFFANFDGDSSSTKDDIKDRSSAEQQRQQDLDRWW